ncbi:hypothetical protein C7271_21350 [filamentous cyanobacterium CCP5]|nr:hypothetical protein C7271_21350 [filamentous cyanobacterium CCP5]
MMSNRQFNVPLKRLPQTAGVVAFIVAASVLPACTTEGTEPITEEPVSTETVEAENAQVGEITDALERYEGTLVTVREEISDVVGEYAFLLDEDDFFGGEELLVINASGTPIEIPADPGVAVQVTGVVRELMIADINEEFDVDLDPDLFVDYEQQPVIVAESAALSPDPAEAASDPEQYYGQRLAIVGDIETTLSSNSFLLDEDAFFGGEDLLVISPDGTVSTNADDEVAITGVLRPYIAADFEQEYELGWDLDFQEQIEAEYNQEPVFVADSIYPADDE